ncbi:type I polyketide synthase [Janthinobacterium sp. BJB401]|uniref:type I polyketide synthase n=1 Tax=Janthinobacterium sp. BJB401 TaxID=2745934 RepID=UPI001595C8E5|nr:type I polyketide synthase [Janthinobacterium sp. BJB401]NVI85648.1 acyltransferase domain-containing protein [Janthinobacterium sp. BJB401]
MTSISSSEFNNDAYSVAVIGMAGRFPDAKNVDEFWYNLKNGIENVRTFSDEELLAAGVSVSVFEDKNYVKRGTVVPDFDRFDAEFFGFTPKDAEVADPQQRLFMEVAWEALEHAGYAPGAYPGAIGVFAGASNSAYFLHKIYGNAKFAESVSVKQIQIGNEKDYLCSRVAYHLGLRGPAVAVQTACSTSLVAVHLACQSILSGESDMALAGGASLQTRLEGYMYQPGDIMSPDGSCRTFDEKAAGTAPGNGVAAVLLKSLSKALEDGDTIHAVIRGSAINNDAADKVGFTAPSVNGQAAVITEAMAVADVHPESISYVEAHGTGTILGDPIEMRALQQAFGTSTDKKQFCAIGSLKTNMGHLDTAAGVTGLIKAVLTVREREIAPSLHFTKANPHIDFANSPFYVNASLQQLAATDTPMRAGVSSFGIGGTNAHVIVEEPPRVTTEPSARPGQVLLLSARTPEALAVAGANLQRFLAAHPQTSLADAAYTTQVGRTAFGYRRALVCSSVANAIEQLEMETAAPAPVAEGKGSSVVFMFPGQGAQYVGMGKDLYQTEEVFRTEIDRCAELLLPALGLDLRAVLFADGEQAGHAQDLLRQTQIAQPALFAVGYALARQLAHWGISPDAMAGHSVGEYVAACLAGVFSLPDALALLAQRGKLIAGLPAGRMLAVHASEPALQPLMGSDLWIAAVNAPAICSVSGSAEAVEALERVLREQGIEFQPLHTSHAFHSGMMDPILDEFAAAVSRVKLNVPRIPYVSNVSGGWITAEQATSPAYWCAHLRQAVRFSDGVRTLMQRHAPLFVEVGPGRSLASLLRQHAQAGVQVHAVGALPDAKSATSSATSSAITLMRAAGWLWTHGVAIDWNRFRGQERRRRIPLPTYPFARKRHWINDPVSVDLPAAQPDRTRRSDVGQWFYAPTWKRLPGSVSSAAAASTVHLVLADRHGLSQSVIDAIRGRGEQVIVVTQGGDFASVSAERIEIDAAQPAHYERLLSLCMELHGMPARITHCWSLTPPQSGSAIDQHDGFYSMRFLAHAIGRLGIDAALTVNVLSNGLYAVIGDEFLAPEKATLLGPCQVMALECANLRSRSVDIVVTPGEGIGARLGALLAAELSSDVAETVVALRGSYRWSLVIEPVSVAVLGTLPAVSGSRQHYLITGGLGGVGYAFARYLAENRSAPALTLTGRQPLPPKAEWGDYLRTHADDDAGSRKIGQLQALEALGAAVLYLAADVADEAAMNRMADAAILAFGQLQGIFHAVGQAGAAALRLTPGGQAGQVLAPKLAGAAILSKIFDFSRLDFVILCSSMNAVLPFAGQADAAGADAFLDALAHRDSLQAGGNVLSVNWTIWKDAGMMARAKLPQHLTEDGSGLAALMSNGIAERDAKAVFDVLLASRLPQLIVSPLAFAVTAGHIADVNRSALDAEKAQAVAGGQGVTRADLLVAYAAPGNDVEKTLAGIWQNLFGMETIGVHHDFFDLGGHSLMATQVLSHVRKHLQVDLPLRSLFEATTIAALAVQIEAARVQAETARLENMAAAKVSVQKSIDAMSPEEIAVLLAEKKRLKASQTPLA